MAKKRFTDDLSGLFEQPAPRPEEFSPAEKTPSDATAANEQEEAVEVEIPKPSPRAKRRLSSKGFTADLDAFLSDSFEREAKPSAPAPNKSNPAPAPPPRSRRRRTGLDLLIRSTVTDEQRDERGKKDAETKRVTLIFKKDHLATLKEQAKNRNMYLKDVVQEMVAQYLAE